MERGKGGSDTTETPLSESDTGAFARTHYSDTAKLAETPVTPDVQTLAAEVGRLYPAVYQRFHVSRHTLPGADVTQRMLSVLQHMAASGPLTVSELATHLTLGKSTTTELVDRLEAKGLVARMRDERDQRRVFIWLTDAGRDRAAMRPRVLEDETLARALAHMSVASRRQLVEGLRALLRAADAIDHD
ncbi:MAG TPA: MarR family transcriptional regulator [Ktedonobacterales bacterium]|nr:MarR family transcriptional regulator [Ktedonobacterales bacterium]